MLCVCLGLALLVVLVFGKVVSYDFVNYDDGGYVYDNPHVAQGLTTRSVAWALTTGHNGNWHPVTWISHIVDVELFGLKRGRDASALAGPGGHHLTNVVLHLLNTLLLFLVLKAMTDAIWPAAWVAALFAVHPMHVESVAWVSERKDVLSGLFWMLTMLAYVAYTRRRTVPRYVLVMAIYAVGLGAKTMLVTLPCVLLLLDFWPLGRVKPGARRMGHAARGPANPQSAIRNSQFTWLILEKVPLFALAAAASVVTVIVERSAGTVHSLEVMSSGQRLINVLTSYQTYITKMVWPSGLAVLYPLQINELSVWRACLAFLLLAAATIAAFRYRHRWPWYCVGWLWFLGTLVPVIGFVQIGSHAYADRYTYLPFVGLFIALGYGLRMALGDWPYGRAVLAAAVVAALTTCAWVQTSYWQNSLTLFSRAVAVTTLNHTAHNNLGNALTELGRPREAVVQYRHALRIKPDYARAHYNLGLVLPGQGKTAEAIEHYRQALRFKPDFADTHYNLGLTLQGQGKIAEAIEHYHQALKIKPEFAMAHNNLGLALQAQGEIVEAIEHYHRALRIKPDEVVVHYNLGVVLQGQGKTAEAIEHYHRTLQINPDYADAYNNLGNALQSQGKIAEAIEHYYQALRIKPDFAKAHCNLAITLQDQGRPEDAITHYQEALRIKPDSAETHNTLGIVFAKQGQLVDAARCFEQAVRLKPDFRDARDNLRKAQDLLQQKP